MSVSAHTTVERSNYQGILGEKRAAGRIAIPRWIALSLELIGVVALFLIPTLWVFGIPFILLAKIFGG